MSKTPTGMGKLQRLTKGGRWFFWCDGSRVYAPTGYEKKAAEDWRRNYLSDLARGSRVVGSENCRIGDLLDLVEQDYERAGKRSIDALRSRLKRLRPALGSRYASDFGDRDIERYRDDRLSEKAAPATVNRELEVLRRALRLGKRRKLVAEPPHVEMLAVSNVRTQRITHAQYRALIGALREPERTAAIIAYHVGWRRGAILGLTWDRVDFDEMVIYPPDGESAQKRVGQAPIYGDMVQALAEAKRTCKDSLHVVVRKGGSPVVDIRKAWDRATKAVGLAGFRFHDLRACAASTLSDAGIPHHEIKRILGHKTDSMFDRYRITSAKRLRSIGEQVAAHLDNEQTEDTGRVI